MPRPKSEHPTELELQILKVLWERNPLTVREVRLALAEGGRPLAHTSVITTLNVMVRKKYVSRSMLGKACLFTPRISRGAAQGRMLDDLVERVFDGSARALMLNLFDAGDLDADDLEVLQQIIKERVKEQQK
jgi:predicted transcriptional regulator